MGVNVESKLIPTQLFWLRNSDLYQYQFDIDELKFYSNLESIQSAS